MFFDSTALFLKICNDFREHEKITTETIAFFYENNPDFKGMLKKEGICPLSIKKVRQSLLAFLDEWFSGWYKLIEEPTKETEQKNEKARSVVFRFGDKDMKKHYKDVLEKMVTHSSKLRNASSVSLIKSPKEFKTISRGIGAHSIEKDKTILYSGNAGFIPYYNRICGKNYVEQPYLLPSGVSVDDLPQKMREEMSLILDIFSSQKKETAISGDVAQLIISDGEGGWISVSPVVPISVIKKINEKVEDQAQLKKPSYKKSLIGQTKSQMAMFQPMLDSAKARNISPELKTGPYGWSVFFSPPPISTSLQRKMFAMETNPEKWIAFVSEEATRELRKKYISNVLNKTSSKDKKDLCVMLEDVTKHVLDKIFYLYREKIIEDGEISGAENVLSSAKKEAITLIKSVEGFATHLYEGIIKTFDTSKNNEGITVWEYDIPNSAEKILWLKTIDSALKTWLAVNTPKNMEV